MSGSVQRHDMPDILGGYDEDDYGERVSKAIANLLPSSHRTEMSEYLPEGVWDFDAFLALETRGKLSISTKERAAAFADTGKGTNLMKSFVALHAVSVTARGLDGEVSTVQVAIPQSFEPCLDSLTLPGTAAHTGMARLHRVDHWVPEAAIGTPCYVAVGYSPCLLGAHGGGGWW